MTPTDLSLFTDFYEFTMMQGYFKNNMAHEVAVFDVYFRNNPNNNGYSVFAGLEQVIEYINTLRFTEETLAYLASLGKFEADFLDYLRHFKFSGDIYSAKEGSVVFPNEPIVKVIAPIMEAHLIEGALLNIINHQSLIATKASRIVQAAGGDRVLELGLRRAQGMGAALYGSRAAIIGGCAATSNVAAGRQFNIEVTGTQSHSWVMSFETELAAFEAYAKVYSDYCMLLVDTHNTLKSGIPNAIKIFDQFKASGKLPKAFGIRLDSGDIAYLSKEARKMLDEAGYPQAVIAASNDLDEDLIKDLKYQKAEITVWGVGTSLITSKSWASFGGVYKLGAIKAADGSFTPKIKLSESTTKINNPGNKRVYRIYDKKTKKMRADLITLTDELIDTDSDLMIFHPTQVWKKMNFKAGTYEVEDLLIPVFKGGTHVYHSPSVMEIQAYAKSQKAALWEEYTRFTNPHVFPVDLSVDLYVLKNALINEIYERTNMN